LNDDPTRVSNMDEPVARLLGRWRLLSADRSLDFAPDVEMEFRPDCQLRYSFAVGEHRQELRLGYRVDGNELHTESPASSHEVTAHFTFAAGDALVFDFGGPRAWFVRQL
jgi:hypothetical protein